MGFTYDNEKQEQPANGQSFTYDDEVEAPSFTRDNLRHELPLIKDANQLLIGTNTKDWSEDEHIDNYMETMRQFSAGNSVTAIRTFNRLNELDEDGLARVGEAFALHETMSSGLTGDDVSWGDTWQAVGDYAGGIVMDPANLIGLGVGKLVAGGGIKAVGTISRGAALKEAAKEGGVRTVAGKEASEKVFNQTITELNKQAAKDIAKRTGTSTAVKEAAITIGVDAAIASGTEYMWQNGMVRTGVYEGYKPSHFAIAALGTMILGGAAYGLSAKGKGASGYKPTAMLPNEDVSMKPVFASLNEGTNKFVEKNTDWKTKVAKGNELESLDTEFWYGLMDEMLPAMQREGYIWVRRNEDDKVSNWLSDLMIKADPVDAQKFLEGFEKSTGIVIKELSGGDKPMELFANTFANKINGAARLMNKTSEIARKLGIKDNQVTYAHLLEDVVGASALDKTSKPIRKLEEGMHQLFGEIIPGHITATQNNTIRLIVANLATTRMNLVGYGMATGLNSVSDITQGILYAGKSGAAQVIGRSKSAAEAWRISRTLFGMQKQKAFNLIDSNTTVDQFRSHALNRPKQMEELMAVLAGGIEDNSRLYTSMGVKPGDTVLGNKIDGAVNFIQKYNAVQAQDLYTKSQEFIYQLDKRLRLSMDRSLPEIMSDPKVRHIMATEEWAEAEAKAVYETSRAIFSKSYRNASGATGEVARFIEDFRNIPFIGITIPFGRFYNNVVATSMDMSGLSLVAKTATGNKFQKDRSTLDLAVRSAVSWAAVSYLADNHEQEWIDRGLGTFEWEDGNGVVRDSKYTFPGSLIKGVARLTAYHRRGEEPPESVKEEVLAVLNVGKTIMDTVAGGGEVPDNVITDIGEFAVGQLTRDLTDATNNILEVGMAMFQNEGLESDQKRADFWDLIRTPFSSVASGATRFLEPLSVAKKVIINKDFTAMDPKDGNRLYNDAWRYMEGFGVTTSKVEKVDAAGGPRGQQPDKFLTDRSNTLTDTERVMNLVGLPHWKLNAFSDSPEANNVFNQYFHSIIEDKSAKLMTSKAFREGNLKTKKVLWGEALGQARKSTNHLMKVKSGHESMSLILEINGAHSKDDINRAMTKIAPGSDITSLDAKQLKVIQEYLKYEDDFIKMRSR